MLKPFISKVADRIDLSEQEAILAMLTIMDGETTPAQIASLITALRMKGETIDEITGFAKVMREKAERIDTENYCIDTCGTGGDGANTFNISTACAFVVAAGGISVAKHGNRAVSSKCGSADVLEALGVKIDLAPDKVKECLDTVRIGFMFAPNFHLSMKNAADPRKEIGIRTIFNILGPLTNPANAKGQLLGVFKPELTEIMAGVLKKLGSEKALIVHGEDGLDEISICGSTKVTELSDGNINTYSICPEDFGLNKANIDTIKGGDKFHNASIINKILSGEKSAMSDAVILNSGAGFYVGKLANTIQDGVNLAKEIIYSGTAMKKLEDFVLVTNRLGGESL